MTADRRVAIVKLFFLKNKQSLVKVQYTDFVDSAVMKHCCDKLTMCCRNCLPHFWLVSGRTVMRVAFRENYIDLRVSSSPQRERHVQYVNI